MVACCPDPVPGGSDPRIDRRLDRRILGLVLGINGTMFVVEMAAGWHAESVALQADALDFLGDSLNYAITLFVMSRSLAWRAGTAMLKGLTMLGFGVFILAASVGHALGGSAPEASVMGVIGAVALVANLVSAALLFRFRAGESNLRAVWLCSRNDAIGNLAVMAAAAGVYFSATAWPDLAVGVVMATLAIGSGGSVIRQARAEMRQAPVDTPAE